MLFNDSPILMLASTSVRLADGAQASISFEIRVLQSFLQEMENKLKAVEDVKNNLSQLASKLELLNPNGNLHHLENARTWVIKAVQATSPKQMLGALGHALQELKMMDSQKVEDQPVTVNQGPQDFLQMENISPSDLKRTTPVLLMTLLGMEHSVRLLSRASAMKTTSVKRLYLFILHRLRKVGWQPGSRLDSDQQKMVLRILRRAKQNVVLEFEKMVDEVSMKLR